MNPGTTGCKCSNCEQRSVLAKPSKVFIAHRCYFWDIDCVDCTSSKRLKLSGPQPQTGPSISTPLQFFQLLDKVENRPKLSLTLPDNRLNPSPTPTVESFGYSLSLPSCETPSFDVEEIENPNRAVLVPSPSLSTQSSTESGSSALLL